MDDHQPIQVDVGKVLASKLGRKAWLVPSFAVDWLKRTICQDTINEKLRLYHPLVGADFCDAALKDLKIEVDVKHEEKLPPIGDKRVIFVCNHPLGGLDGLALISMLTRHYGSGIRFIVNDILMALEPLRCVFLPINKHGRQSREAITDINAAMAGPEPLFVFPAGLVSRQGANGDVRDLKWNKMFVSKALQYERDVVPLYFSGRNSDFFYRLARWRKRLLPKVNIEMLYLPNEALSAEGSKFTVVVGDRVPWRLLGQANPSDMAQAMRETVYRLAADAR